MLIPNSGNVRGDFQANMADWERVFMHKGLRLISPAITGRVVSKKDTESGTEYIGANLSDAERALILATESNAEALLQVGELIKEETKWSDIYGEHYYIAAKKVDSNSPKKTREKIPLIEVEKHVYSERDVPGLTLRGDDKLCFTGKLIDVETGEIMISFDLIGLTVKNPPVPYEGIYFGKENSLSLRVHKENFRWSGREWREKAWRSLSGKLVEQITDLIRGSE